MPQPLMPKKLKLTGSVKTYKPSRTNTKKRCPFHHRRSECKSRSQEIPGLSGKFGLEVQNEAGQKLTEFCHENTQVIANTLFQQHKRWFLIQGVPRTLLLWYLTWVSSIALGLIIVSDSFSFSKRLPIPVCLPSKCGYHHAPSSVLFSLIFIFSP